MKIILIRHEKRNLINPLFFTPLTDEGLRDRYIIRNLLSTEHIDEIYSSPFLRTIQTSIPLSEMTELPLKIDYGLYEYIHNPAFSLWNWYHTVDELYKDNPEIEKYIDKNYESIVTKDDFNVLENESDLANRITKFMNPIIEKYKNTNKTIAIISHQGTLNKIKDLYFVPTQMNSEFPMGHFEIYNL